jgi:hypothetical protein
VYAGPVDEDELDRWYETGVTNSFPVSVLLPGELLDGVSTASFPKNMSMSASASHAPTKRAASRETDLIARAGHAMVSSLAVLPVCTEEDTDDDDDKPSVLRSGSRTRPAGEAARPPPTRGIEPLMIVRLITCDWECPHG